MKNITSFLYLISRKATKTFSEINNFFLRLSNPQYKEVERWYRDDPHSLKRSTFNYLNEKSVVFDLGGYEGQWTSDIYSRYRCKVFIFEPVANFYHIIKDRFTDNSDIQVFQFGLSGSDQDIPISINEFASSVINIEKGSETELIKIRSFSKFLETNSLLEIDLMKINIEGSEYELLSDLIQTGFIKNVKGLLIQFHNFIPKHPQQMSDIKHALSSTHRAVFQYEFVWEYWILKDFKL